MAKIPHEISMAHPIGPPEGGSFPDSLPQTPSDPGAKKPQMPWHHGTMGPGKTHGNFGGNLASVKMTRETRKLQP